VSVDRQKRVIDLLAKLPGVGEKTAQRYLLFFLTADEAIARNLGDELVTLRDHLKPCERCGNIAEVDASAPQAPQCSICQDHTRDASVLCVVARVTDLIAIERAGAMRGRYFVLGRLLSPLEGVGPDELPLPKLVQRIRDDHVREVIVATPPSVDGEATALLLKRELAPLGVAVSRIASGVPHGGDLEFADPITMARSLAGRQKL
jgi:recombination protein RecR